MGIRVEFQRLSELPSTPVGWAQIEWAWMIALNNEQSETGEWIRRSLSSGDKVRGFAIDPVTRRYTIGPVGHDHDRPFTELQAQLQNEVLTYEEGDAIEWRILDGRLAHID